MRLGKKKMADSYEYIYNYHISTLWRHCVSSEVNPIQFKKMNDSIIANIYIISTRVAYDKVILRFVYKSNTKMGDV